MTRSSRGREQQVNKNLQRVIAKTAAGLMNSDGGTLLIGVADDGSIVGIENDIASLSTGNLDGFEQAFRQVLADNIGLEFSYLVNSAYEAANGLTVAVMKVAWGNVSPTLMVMETRPRVYIVC